MGSKVSFTNNVKLTNDLSKYSNRFYKIIIVISLLLACSQTYFSSNSIKCVDRVCVIKKQKPQGIYFEKNGKKSKTDNVCVQANILC